MTTIDNLINEIFQISSIKYRSKRIRGPGKWTEPERPLKGTKIESPRRPKRWTTGTAISVIEMVKFAWHQWKRSLVITWRTIRP